MWSCAGGPPLAQLTARWEKRLGDIARGLERESAFVSEMRGYASRLVGEVKTSDAVYRHDNVTREKCPDCGKFLLAVQGKRGKMLVCPDRECGYRRSVTRTTNARCPNCHKKMELRGEGEKQLFACVCGYRERLSDFKKRHAHSAAGKRDVQRFLQNQREEKGTSAMAEQLKSGWSSRKMKNGRPARRSPFYLWPWRRNACTSTRRASSFVENTGHLPVR